MSDWKAVLAGASAQRTLERARKAIGRNTKYELGKGGFDPRDVRVDRKGRPKEEPKEKLDKALVEI